MQNDQSKATRESEPSCFYNDLLIFFKHFPHTSDSLFIILIKGHLLIERLVREFINEKVPNPASLAKAKLECEQAIYLAMALSKAGHLDWYWQAAIKLNKLRNKLAHNLEPKGFKDTLEDFLTYVENHRASSEKLTDDPARLVSCVAAMHTGLSVSLRAKPAQVVNPYDDLIK